ncbi:MAG: class II fructose-bisphosphate aldolase [Ruminococcaceae bacterium]|nr:class II fructose-bisphosphate aldolase [Oscillospiraceae bacterium]
MLVTFDEILSIADKGGFAIPAFNVYNMETTMGIIAGAEAAKAPVILQFYSRLAANEEGYYLAPIVLAAAKAASVPVCFHLDHGAGEKEIMRAIRYGATGAMIDASTLPMDENIAVTKKIRELCGYNNIQIEGEIGHIGSAAAGDEESTSTTVEEAVTFANETGVRALAIMVGTAHGRYKKAPKLDIDRIAEIHAAIPGVSLVLHGGSGIPDEQIKAAIDAGIRKINFGTDVCFSFLDKVFETSRETYAVDLFMKGAVQNVKAFAIEKINLLGAANRA